MRFTASTITALFFAGALANPANVARQDSDPASEDVSITEFAVHKAGADGTSAGTVDGASFKLSGNDGQNIDCSATASQITAGVPTGDLACGSSKYKFSVLAGADANSFGLKITHDA